MNQKYDKNDKVIKGISRDLQEEPIEYGVLMPSHQLPHYEQPNMP